jgi:RNA polymerase sigma-70 factor, ECF subfamily
VDDVSPRAIDPVPGLVEQARRGDKDAFGQLYRLHRRSILAMARLQVGNDADDVVAEVFLRAWSALPRYRDTGAPFVSWLFGIARHVIVDEFRRRARAEPTDELPDPGVQSSPEDALSLVDAIAALPDEQRQVIELKFFVGMRNVEVAQALGTSIGAVNAKQWRALARLRMLLEDER